MVLAFSPQYTIGGEVIFADNFDSYVDWSTPSDNNSYDWPSTSSTMLGGSVNADDPDVGWLAWSVDIGGGRYEGTKLGFSWRKAIEPSADAH